MVSYRDDSCVCVCVWGGARVVSMSTNSTNKQYEQATRASSRNEQCERKHHEQASSTTTQHERNYQHERKQHGQAARAQTSRASNTTTRPNKQQSTRASVITSTTTSKQHEHNTARARVLSTITNSTIAINEHEKETRADNMFASSQAIRTINNTSVNNMNTISTSKQHEHKQHENTARASSASTNSTKTQLEQVAQAQTAQKHSTSANQQTSEQTISQVCTPASNTNTNTILIKLHFQHLIKSSIKNNSECNNNK